MDRSHDSTEAMYTSPSPPYDSAKDISELAFGVNFHNKVGKPVYSSESVIPPGVSFKVTGVDAEGRLILRQKQ